MLPHARSNGETVLRAVAISAAPCGHCRQFFCELSGADDIKFLFGDPLGHFTLEELLPFRCDAGGKGGAADGTCLGE